MKCPSRRNSLPNGSLSCTSTSWYGERNASSLAFERTKTPHPSVMYSVRTRAARSPDGDASLLIFDQFQAAATNRLHALAVGRERLLERVEHALRLVGVVRRVVAH